MGLRFRIASPDVPEDERPGEPPEALALRLSTDKARSVAATDADPLVVAADTIVVDDGRVLGKPMDADEATRMLRHLRGRRHRVLTGLAIVRASDGWLCRQLASTPVHMAHYSERAIAEYVAGGDPLDKAGAYAIQSAVLNPVARVVGCYANVVGLPMCHLYRALALAGVRAPVHPLDACPLAVSQGCPWSREITSAPAEGVCADSPPGGG